MKNICIRNISNDKRTKRIWCDEDAKMYDSIITFAREKNVPPQQVYSAIHRGVNVVHGWHFSLEEDIFATQQMMSDQIQLLRKAEKDRVARIAKTEERIHFLIAETEKELRNLKGAY